MTIVGAIHMTIGNSDRRMTNMAITKNHATMMITKLTSLTVTAGAIGAANPGTPAMKKSIAKSNMNPNIANGNGTSNAESSGAN